MYINMHMYAKDDDDEEEENHLPEPQSQNPVTHLIPDPRRPSRNEFSNNLP